MTSYTQLNLIKPLLYNIACMSRILYDSQKNNDGELIDVRLRAINNILLQRILTIHDDTVRARYKQMSHAALTIFDSDPFYRAWAIHLLGDLTDRQAEWRNLKNNEKDELSRVQDQPSHN